MKKWYIGKVNKKGVNEEFIKEVTANVQNTQLEELEDINKMWNKIKQEKECTYNVTLRRVRATIFALEKQ